jgi:hypothetical protein
MIPSFVIRVDAVQKQVDCLRNIQILREFMNASCEVLKRTELQSKITCKHGQALGKQARTGLKNL